MSNYIVKPAFVPKNNALLFNVGSLNALVTAEINDNFEFYQQQFGVYHYMELNSEQEYKIHYPVGLPFLWQVHNSCAWTPTKTLDMGTNTVIPCKIKVNEQMCYDEHFEGTYNAFNEWGNRPNVELSPEGVAANNALIRSLTQSATMGNRMLNTVGGLINLSTVAFESGTKSKVEDAYRSTINSCNGWLQAAVLLHSGDSTKYAHLNKSTFINTTDISTNGKNYVGTTTGTIVDLFDEIRDDADTPEKLKESIIEGGMVGHSQIGMPLFLLAMPEYYALYGNYLDQSEATAQNRERIRQVEYTFNTLAGPKPMLVYTIDGVPCVPIKSSSWASRYVTGTLHFAYLTLAGNIQFGNNYRGIPVAGYNDVGMMIQRSDNLEDLGTFKFLSHGLTANAFADTDLIAGNVFYATPA